LKNLNIVKLFNESLSVQAFSGNAQTMFRVINESVQTGETFILIRGLITNIVESITVGRHRIFQGIFQGNGVFHYGSETEKTMTLSRIFNESVSVQVFRGTARSMFRIINETVNMSSLVSLIRGRLKSINESVQIGLDIFQNGVYQIGVYRVGEALRAIGITRQLDESISVQVFKGRMLDIVKWHIKKLEHC
jgi:hypothetical protein